MQEMRFMLHGGVDAGKWRARTRDYRRVVARWSQGVSAIIHADLSSLTSLEIMNALRLTLAFCTSLAAFAAAAMTDGRTTQDRPFISGGVSQDELADLRTKQPFFTSHCSLPRALGAHLAGVRVRIVDGRANGARNRDGWPVPARRSASCSISSKRSTKAKRKARAHAARRQRQRVVLYFKSDADVSPDLKR